jgi:acyl-CoA synthetase (NDP forming)
MYPLGRIRRGTVAYVGQTGNFGTHGLHWLLSNESYGVSRVVGLGNQVDVGFAEVFEYLAEDMETETVCVYIEGLGEEGDERFIEAARRLSRRKPVIALKGGATLAGARAVGLHTASRLTGWEAETVFAKTGIVRVERYQDLFEHTKALAFQPLPRGNRVAVIVPSGGMGVMAADACEREGLELATLSEETLGKLRALSQPWITVSDPIDYWSAVLGRGVEGAYGPGMEAVLEDPGVDALVSITIVLDGEPMPDFSFVRLLAVRHPDKPILMAISGDKKPFEEARRFLEERSVPVYLPVEGAIEALGTMYRCSRARMPAEVLGNLPAGKHG